MKTTVSSVRLGLTFAGCFLGAGYISGREIWRFFGMYGPWGWLGLLAAMGALAFLGGMTLHLAPRTGDDSLERLVFPGSHPFLHRLVFFTAVVFLFGVSCIMTAGAGALLRQVLGLSRVWTSLLFALIVAVVALTGLDGLVASLSFTTPVLTVSAVVISVLAITLFCENAVPPEPERTGWLFSAVAFSSYNMFTSVAILAPLGRYVTEKQARRGIALGTALLLLIASCFMAALYRNPSAVPAELPMLAVAWRISPVLELFFALLLLLAMFGTSLSCFTTGIRQLASCTECIRKRRTLCVFAVSFLAWAGSLFGFGRLIDYLYPAFGCVSFLFLVCMCVNFFRQEVTGGEQHEARRDF